MHRRGSSLIGSHTHTHAFTEVRSDTILILLQQLCKIITAIISFFVSLPSFLIFFFSQIHSNTMHTRLQRAECIAHSVVLLDPGFKLEASTKHVEALVPGLWPDAHAQASDHKNETGTTLPACRFTGGRTLGVPKVCSASIKIGSVSYTYHNFSA